MPGWGRVPANGLVVLGESAAALIDTAWTDEQTGLLFDWVAREHGIEIEHVVATHSHADCAGGLAEAHRRGARSYGSTLTAELAGQEGNPVPRTTFEERHTIDLGGTEVELRYLGAGHTRDNIVAWLPQQRLLFGGCLVKRTGAGEGYVEEADLTAWPQTIRALRAAYPDVEVVVPGPRKAGRRRDTSTTPRRCSAIARRTALRASARSRSRPCSRRRPR